jgi:hypothetical protein
MRYSGVLVTLWLVGSFAVGAIAFSPLDGAALSFATTFVFWALVRTWELRTR